MIGDISKFLTLKNVDGGTMNFGDNATTNIVGKGTISLDYRRIKIKNVLHVDGLKHNLLSVS